jgi:glycosyltransferase involved in cell wall biosynthesis
MLAVVQTHPIQYHAPVFRALQSRFNIPVTAIYGSDFSVTGYHDEEFGTAFAWDTDLLSGYSSIFLSTVSSGGARGYKDVSSKGLRAALQKIQPRAVLVGEYRSSFSQMTLYRIWKAKYPILFRGETTDHAQERGVFKDKVRARILRQLYTRCARLLYIGQHSYQHFRKMGCPEEKLVFSPYCIDTSPFQMDEASRARLRGVTRESLGITEAETVLLFSGKLIPRKRPDLILHAIKALPQAIRERIVVVFLGDGSLSEELRTLAQSGPSVRVIFPGFQNQTLVSRYYHAADVLVLPSSYFETWGLVVNDALHHGLPCVVSQAVGCAPDLVDAGTTGETFETDSAESLSLALRRSMALVGRLETRERCRERVSGYTVEKAAEGIANAYYSATRNNSTARRLSGETATCQYLAR